MTTDGQSLLGIPTDVSSPIKTARLPHGWEHSNDWSGRMRVKCVTCATKEREEQAALKDRAIREGEKRKARRDKKKTTAASG